MDNRLIDYTKYSHSDILASYQTQYNNVVNFRAKAQLTLTYMEKGTLKSDDIRAEITLNQNDSLFIQLTYSVLNIDVSSIFIGKDHFIFKTRTDEDDVFIRGFVTDNYLNHIFKIDLPVKQWAKTLFMGRINVPASPYESRVSPTGEVTFQFDSFHLNLRKDALLPETVLVYNEQNRVSAKLQTFGLIQVGDYEFPQKIVYFNPLTKSEIIVEYSEIELNKKLDSSHFTVKIPPNIRQVSYE
jgi:hypothetical protein